MDGRRKLFLISLTFVVMFHAPSLTGGFVWDDHTIIEANPTPGGDNLIDFDHHIIDSLGNLYAFGGEGDGTNADEAVTIFRAGGGTATISYADVIAVSGGGAFECEDVAILESPSQISLFCTDDSSNSNGIVRFDFPVTATTSVGGYSLYR